MHLIDEGPGAILSFKTFLSFINRLLVTVMAPHSSTLAWKSHGWRSLVRISPWGREERLSDFPFPFHFHALEKEMAPHSSVLAWRLPGTEEPVGLPSMGSHRVGHN